MTEFRLFVFLAVFFLFKIDIRGQDSVGEPYDSAGILDYEKKRPIQATLLTEGLNMGVWSFDRYVKNAEYAKIGFDTMKENFKKGFVWDNDQMSTNIFMHPYHGNLYFNSARESGFNFWQSGLFALGGSAMWEFLMESEYPSANDIISTPFGGMALGEVCYRISDLLVDDRTRGLNRIGREVGVFMISPIKGVLRVVNGEAWQHREIKGSRFNDVPVDCSFSLGMRTLYQKDGNGDFGIGLVSEFQMEYGDKFSEKNSVPFSYFRLNASLNIQKSQPILGEFNIIGRLLNKPLIETEKLNLNIGVFQHFDYYDSDSLSQNSKRIPYKFGTPASVGLGAMVLNRNFLNGTLNGEIYVNGVLLGAVLSDYYLVDARNYNFSCGVNVNSNVDFKFCDNKYCVSLSHNYYRLFTSKGYGKEVKLEGVNPKTINVQGDESQSSIYFMKVRFDAKVVNNLYLSMSMSNVLRCTDYKYFNKIYSNSFDGRLMLTYRF